MLGLLDWIKLGVGAAAGAIVAGVIVYPIAHWKGDSQGYSRRVAEIAAADVKAELERKGDNAKLAGMSDYDLCVSGLRGSGMPVGACDQLRGVPESKP
ncbi:hypothetical protein [Mesorhizobium sp. B1-1-2]|uniref:hypothetical protein n=1 Tax=Mesorhizobium sp. B1-1-2 TaxID=2589982 RepID=UPI00112744ED|nr:hypothetical protein [Mesorhizobium sp. B1-1-2]TPN79953.1 hypothetical protein FJ985_01600 [Mesorhizobium sp. B1-1-2]